MLLCSLLTLANEFFCETTHLKWPRKRPQIRFLESPEDVALEHLYPSLNKPPVRLDEHVPERLNVIWGLYHRLPKESQRAFLTALYAYYSGQSMHSKHSTQASVAYIAALNALAKNRKQVCSGRLTCSMCGNLPIKHNLIGDKAAIVDLVQDMLQPTIEQHRELKALINRVYADQRSAFVHGAQLRHEEFHEGFGLPLCFPTSERPVRRVFFYRQDFASIAAITRRTLLQWLSKEADLPLDNELMKLEELRINIRMLGGDSISLPPNTVVAPFHDGRKQSDNGKHDK